MSYVGNPIDTQNTFQSLVGKRFNGDGSTTDFTLDVAPGNVLDIEVFVGNVRQDPNSAYTVSGTTLSFTGAPPSGTNNIYVVHQAKSVGTIDVPAGGVAAGSLATSVLTGQTDIGADIADADLFLVDDGAGGTLRKTAASRIKTYAGFSVSSITGATALGAEPATTDEFVLSDAGTLKRVDYSHIRGSKVLLATASRTSGSVGQVYMSDFMDSTKYISYIAHCSFKNAGNGNNQFFNFTSSGGSTMEATNYYGAGNILKNANGTVTNGTREIATNENKVSWTASASTRVAFMEFVMHPIGVTTDSGVSTVFYRGQTDRWNGSAREPQYVTGAAYYINTTVPTGFVIGASGGNWERYEIAVYGLKKA